MNRMLYQSATAQTPLLPADMDGPRRIAANAALPMEERLEAYEDIIDSEVGDTTLIRARNVERELGFKQIYLKFEGGNPTGTQKDRIAFTQVKDALRRGFDTITLATCGNYGVAATLAASLAGMRCIIYLPGNYGTQRVEEMKALGAEIMRVHGDYEQAVLDSRHLAQKREYYDANPGGDNSAIQLHAYGQMAYEMYDELHDAPAVVAVPVSNGTTLAGIYRGFISLHRRGKTSRIPRMVAGSSFRKNPIVQAFLKKTPACFDLVPNTIKETKINEPLVNWHAIDGDHALDAIRNSAGWADYASDKKLVAYSRLIRDKEGLHVLPASTAGLVAMAQAAKTHPFRSDRYIIILTGRKS